MNEQIKHAFEEYRKAVQAEQSLSDEIQGREDKRPTGEDTEKLERMGADIDLWRKETERLLQVAKRSAEVDEVRAQFATLFQQDDKSERQTEPDDNARLVAMNRRYKEDGTLTGFDSSYTVANIQALANRFQNRALSTPGGTAFGTTFIDRVLFYEVDESPMLDPAVVQVIATPRGEAMEFPRLTADANVAGTLTAEAAALNEADPTISKVTLNAYKYGGITLWSAELDEDNVIALRDILAQSAARHIVEQVNGPLTTGDGSNKPQGIVPAATNGGTATGTSSANVYFGPNDVIDLFYGRKAAYRRRGNWMANSATLAQIRKLEDGQGMKIWQPSLIPGQPETVLGRPIFENPDMANGSAAKALLFGDTQRYITRRVGAARVELSRDYKFNTDQLALKVVERIDGDLLDANAVAVLVNAAV